MVFDLIAKELGLVRVERFVEQSHGEIADADQPCLAGSLRCGKGCERLAQRHILARPVDEQQIDIVEAEPVEDFVHPACNGFGLKIIKPDLAGDEKLLTSDTAFANRPSNLKLVAI